MTTIMNRQRWTLGLLSLLMAGPALATVEYIEHLPTAGVYGEAGSVTQREPDAPQPGDNVDIWVDIGYSFYYTDVKIYYTTDGSEPAGTTGTPSGTTQVITPSFVRNEPNSPNIDWWKGTLPVSGAINGTVVKYKISAWHNLGGPEVFANNYGCSDNTCDNPSAPATVFTFTIGGGGGGALPWPGAGYGEPSPSVGFPSIHFWKEEAVVGNNYMNVMLDLNGTAYDIYFPSAGCVQGVSTKNEGYVDGLDTFPPGLPLGNRGQMHINQAQAGIRVNGTTYWLSNKAGDAYTNHSQAYVPDNNVVSSTCTFVKEGCDITVQQYDFCPIGITYPATSGTDPIREIYVKRYLLTNNAGTPQTIDFYYTANFALNGGDGYDAMFADKPRGAMVAYDNTYRTTSGSGEYNPTFFGDYEKDVSVYLAASMKVCDSVGSATGTPATDSWRDTSGDNDAGWIASRITLAAGQTREVNVAFVGGFDNFAGASGTYNYWVAPGLDWFLGTSMASVQSSTEAYWAAWLAGGVDVDFPDDTYDALYRRSMLATALHVDGENGGVIAGMHNGAYPFVWPRDALYAAVTLARTGHTTEAEKVFDFLREVTYRDNEEPGRKGFWKQKYTTDGYVVWSAPQVDETANVPWAAYYYYLTTGDTAFLNSNYAIIYEAGRAMSEDSNVSAQLYYNDTYKLMYSNNVWEDSYDLFLYSNATVERGLRDAARIADTLDQLVCPGGPGTCNYHNDKSLFEGRATNIHDGLNGRLDWNGENTDISQLGLVWPFETHSPTDSRMVTVIDRMNGVATDAFSNNHPLVNFSGEFQDLINRYWGDTYWNGGPWFLSTLWYGQYYAKRADFTTGKADIDNHKYRIDRTADFLGPVGLGAEQMAPSNSLLYAGQTDFRLQAAWPNAWESMSLIADSIMLFLDHKPDAPNQKLILAPKLPTAWSTMTYENLPVGAVRVNVTCSESPGTKTNTHSFTNVTGGTLNIDTIVRIPAGESVASVTRNGSPVAWTSAGTARVRIQSNLETGAASTTTFAVVYGTAATPPVVTAVKSRKVHGGAGSFDIDPLVATGTECRNGGPTTVVVTFDQSIQRVNNTNADVTVSSGTVSGLAVSGADLTITLSGASNAAKLTLGFPGIAAATSLAAVSTDDACIPVLAGDVDGNRSVTIFDLLAVRQVLNQAVTGVNFRRDVVANGGSIAIFDLLAVRQNLNLNVPACP